MGGMWRMRRGVGVRLLLRGALAEEAAALVVAVALLPAEQNSVLVIARDTALAAQAWTQARIRCISERQPER